MNRDERGLTVVELLIVMVVTGLLTGLIFSFSFSYWKQGIVTQTELNAMVERLNASDYLRENLSQATGLVSQNSVPDENVHTPDPTEPSGKTWQEIHAYKGLKSNTSGATPVIYYKRYSVDSAKNIIFNGQLPYEDDYIVYMDAATKQLRVRVLANPEAPGNATATTCPPEATTPTCASDKILVNDITGVDLRYFTKAGLDITYSETEVTDTSVVPNVTYTVYGPDYPVVEVVELTLKLTKQPNPKPDDALRTSTIIRVALRNS